MRRVIGIDIHRSFGEVVIWEDGRLRNLGRVEMTRTALEGLGGEVVIEATGNCMAVSRVLSLFVKRVVIANPLQVKAGADPSRKVPQATWAGDQPRAQTGARSRQTPVCWRVPMASGRCRTSSRS